MTTSETPVHITEDEDAEEADADVDDGDADVEDKKSSRSRTSRTSRQSRTSKQSRTSRLSRTKSQGRVLKNRIPFALNFEASHDWQVMLLSGTKPEINWVWLRKPLNQSLDRLENRNQLLNHTQLVLT